MTEHHRPNTLPPDHVREDFDFLYKDGVSGPIRLAAQVVPEIYLDSPGHVWCKRHGWEVEL